ncbi:anthranilate synthase component II [Sneathiella sp.]|jgi:anthranilate synthase component 2|uniref:anthranilate synthase component II n=1 Tax=Sneathiella sp. TaxID=1964365 RepID=UPI0039E3215E
MIVLIDNYDSFTYNLVHFMGELGADIKVFRNDVISVDDVLALNPTGIVLSPGPCTPDKAGICLDMVKTAAATNMPLLGVCLGHQSIGQAFGGKVVRADELMHGKTSPIQHENVGVFKGLPDNFVATRYHSLTVAPDTVPDCLSVTARTEDGVIMGLQHKEKPLHGVQFHPESIASEHGHQLLRNFLELTDETLRAVA